MNIMLFCRKPSNLDTNIHLKDTHMESHILRGVPTITILSLVDLTIVRTFGFGTYRSVIHLNSINFIIFNFNSYFKDWRIESKSKSFARR